MLLRAQLLGTGVTTLFAASLTGETFDGQAIQGSDSIVTVGCR
jgi:hypothetical protein